MSVFTLHDETTAPEASRALMESSRKNFGFLPGLHQVLSESPQAYEAYQMLHKLFQDTSLDKDELTVVWQAINVEHECHYCVPAHTRIAKAMKVDDAIIDALRNETPLPSPKLEALRSFTLAMLRSRGNVTKEETDAFLAAGYSPRHILEIILGLAQKVMSNYVNHIAETPTDPRFAEFAWTRRSDRAA